MLAAALGAGDVACVELAVPADAAAARAAVERLRDIAQAAGVAFLLRGDAALAAKAQCDGVVVDPAGYGAARKAVGGQAIVGVVAGTSRHEAMEAGEAGADFIGFDADPEIVSWWTEMMEIPCVAALPDADFRRLAAEGWTDPQAAAAAVRALG
ncbi:MULTISPECIES: thiamine phosphate synthase [Inquilinus]|uniref:Thiamine-phosphate pyrophosphorylase n=1 Tax=Inquilinus ginsengisoli TaxID=363840 RepID=A0ABU1JR52_9PROT|nr:thiamine phosphate synthase [Inquilinus ginsengisoli]MDR6291101.1 thiamine-phosphate pyrophosphorylase [Inquilinus ginsengisoli]